MAWRIERVERVASTNSAVARRARGGEPAGLVMVARQQTAGRGRQGRSWMSEAGRSLTFSALRRPDVPASQGWRWPLIAGLATRAAVAPLLPGPGAWLKWPNDLLVGERKLCGVLCELVCRGDEVASIVVGVGLNLRPPVAGWPPELSKAATSIEEAGGGGGPIAEGILERFLEVLPGLEACPAVELVQSAADAMAPMLGRAVRVEGDDRRLTVAGLADNGALLVVDEAGASRRLLAGDVHLLPE